jgi:hypothetical protein
VRGRITMVLASPSMARNAGSTTSLPVCKGELAPLLTIQDIDEEFKSIKKLSTFRQYFF